MEQTFWSQVVRYTPATSPFSRMGSLQPTGYLLRRPLQSELPCHDLAQPRTVCQLTILRATSADPGLLISLRRTASLGAAIPADFSAHRRWRPAQMPGHRPCRLSCCKPSRYRLALRQRQCQPRTTTQRRTDPAVPRNLAINRRRRLTKRTTYRLQRLAPLPAIPHRRFLRRRETPTFLSNHHKTLHPHG